MSDSPYIVHLDANNLNDVLIEGSKKQPVLVDIWADWCQPCLHLMPILERVVDDYKGAFILAKLDAVAHEDIAAQMGVRGFPTCRLFKDGKAIDEFTGAIPESDIRRFLDEYIEDATVLAANDGENKADSA